MLCWFMLVKRFNSWFLVGYSKYSILFSLWLNFQFLPYFIHIFPHGFPCFLVKSLSFFRWDHRPTPAAPEIQQLFEQRRRRVAETRRDTLSMAGVAIGARVLAHFYVPLAGWEILMISWAPKTGKTWRKMGGSTMLNEVQLMKTCIWLKKTNRDST